MFYASAIINIIFILTAFALALFAARDWWLVGLIFLMSCLALLYRYLSGARARKNLAKLSNLRKSIKDNVKIGETIIVPSGERLSADGAISDGEAILNEFPLTGLPQQILRRKDDLAYASTINEGGDLKIIARKVGRNTMIAKAIDTIRAAKNFPSGFQKKAAVATIVFGGFIFLFGGGAYFGRVGGINTFIALLLVFSSDMGVFSIGKIWEARVSRMALHGVVVKKEEVLEKVASIRRVVFNLDDYFSRSRKNFVYLRAFWSALDNDILSLASSAERYSDHPLADAILAEAHRRSIKYHNPDSFSVIKGEGVAATVDGAKIIVGSENLININNVHIQEEIKKHIDAERQRGVETALVAKDSKIIGALSFSDAKKTELKIAVSQLETLGVEKATKESSDKPALIVGIGSDAAENSSKNIRLSVDALSGGVFPEESDIVLMGDSFGALQKIITLSRETKVTLRNMFILLSALNIIGVLLIWKGFFGPYGAISFHAIIEFFIFIFVSRTAKNDEML